MSSRRTDSAGLYDEPISPVVPSKMPSAAIWLMSGSWIPPLSSSNASGGFSLTGTPACTSMRARKLAICARVTGRFGPYVPSLKPRAMSNHVMQSTFRACTVAVARSVYVEGGADWQNGGDPVGSWIVELSFAPLHPSLTASFDASPL